MKVSEYQFRIKYQTESRSVIRKRRLGYIKKFGYKGEKVSAEDMVTLEYLDSIECHLQELTGRIDSGWLTDPVQHAMALPPAPETLDFVEDALVPLMQLHDRLFLQLRFAQAKLEAILNDTSSPFVRKWAESLLGITRQHKVRYGLLRNELELAIEKHIKGSQWTAMFRRIVKGETQCSATNV